MKNIKVHQGLSKIERIFSSKILLAQYKNKKIKFNANHFKQIENKTSIAHQNYKLTLAIQNINGYSFESTPKLPKISRFIKRDNSIEEENEKMRQRIESQKSSLTQRMPKKIKLRKYEEKILSLQKIANIKTFLNKYTNSDCVNNQLVTSEQEKLRDLQYFIMLNSQLKTLLNTIQFVEEARDIERLYNEIFKQGSLQYLNIVLKAINLDIPIQTVNITEWVHCKHFKTREKGQDENIHIQNKLYKINSYILCNIQLSVITISLPMVETLILKYETNLIFIISKMQNQEYEQIKSVLNSLPIRRSTQQSDGRRESELAISTIMDNVIQILQFRLHETDQQAKLLVMDVLREFSYFKGIEEQEEFYNYLEQFIMNAEYKLYKKGSFIFHSGDVGDYFYLILKGSANVYVPKAEEELRQQKSLLNRMESFRENLKKSVYAQENKHWQLEINSLTQQIQDFTDKDEQILLFHKHRYFQKSDAGSMLCLYKKVNMMKQGDCFGEVALFQNEPRAASVVAVDNLHVLQLSKVNYMKIFEQKLQKLNFTLDILNRTFKAPREVIIQISFDLIRKQYHMNQALFKEGDFVDGFYIISRGQIESQKKGNIKLLNHCEGQFLGLFDIRIPGIRDYTAVSISNETQVYFLSIKYTFNMHINVKNKLQEMHIQSKSQMQERAQQVHQLNILRKKESMQTLFKELQPRTVVSYPSKPTSKYHISLEKINQIVHHNQNLHCKTERLQKNILLCLNMRDFDKEREFQLKLKTNRRAEVPRMKERPRGLRATYKYPSHEEKIEQKNK
ncbi:hypothetical protein pb186bvf_019585 [Paramecium bursaria]